MLLLLCIIVHSYVPQYRRLRSCRNTDGLSPSFILLRALSTTANLANLLILPTAYATVGHCRRDYSPGRCVVELVTHWQIAADWICFQGILFLYVRYYGRDEVTSQWSPSSLQSPEIVQEEESSSLGNTRTATAIIAINVILDVLLLGPSLFLNINIPIPSPGYYNLMQIWSFTTIAVSTFLALIYHCPQFYYTGTSKRVGSLSIATLGMQTAVYFLLAVSLGVRYGKLEEEDPWRRYLYAFNIWISYLITGFQACVLLGECIYVAYVLSAPKGEQDEGGEAPVDAAIGEQTPLLASRPDEAAG
ncbi:hypothetical protein T310_0239 [Rasamsonia emersonii CBS 393.64]|uniref:PQ loop repeat protein n=1 Tax=Rasamsonia emersonii (strain ATCC 16479 / CBS 393.64 / IMI 116815) TaxID=1408163 RepID=A0A0F4Z6P4_RASE3|nr:hypothetical protein T310_0239 [Rasamsonia emersonii CBS 393.64]KKA25761.1 hypothetical protein T310_0239 [Rasamsonia emersonii CBS 393.64]